jgi:hypothetical protein
MTILINCKILITHHLWVSVLYPAHNCIAGHVVPQYLLPTASHGDVRQASVGERFQLHIHAQASETKYRAITLINNKNKVESATKVKCPALWILQ